VLIGLAAQASPPVTAQAPPAAPVPRSRYALLPVRAEFSATLAVPGDVFRPLDLSGFQSSIHHWRRLRDESRFIQPLPDQASYAPEQVSEIAANLLLFQRANGGWPKDYDMTAVLTAEQRARVTASRNANDASFDNGNLHSQIVYLAQAHHQRPRAEWQAACERGLDFVLRAQYENGGFPQRFPEPKSYHAYITFNDGAMMGVMNLLRDVATPAAHFAWVDDERRIAAQKAVDRGIDCILKCQIRVAGVLTGWCQQHDQMSFEPRPARTFEPISICPLETTEIVRFLISQPQSTAETRAAIEAAVAWLDQAQLHGVRVDTVPAPKTEFLRHTADFDRVVVADPAAPPLWARHYELGTNRPIFVGRDAIPRYSLAEIERERRTGTAWFGKWPQRLLDQEVTAWRRRQ